MWQWLIERSTANVTRSSPPSHRPLILYAPWGCPHPSRPFGISCQPCLRRSTLPPPPPLLGSPRRIAPQFSTSLFVHYAISRPRDDDTVRCFVDLLISRGYIVLSVIIKSMLNIIPRKCTLLYIRIAKILKTTGSNLEFNLSITVIGPPCLFL